MRDRTAEEIEAEIQEVKAETHRLRRELYGVEAQWRDLLLERDRTKSYFEPGSDQ